MKVRFAGVALPLAMLAQQAAADPQPSLPAAARAQARADAVVRQMTPEEKTVLTHGTIAFANFGKPVEGMVLGAGFVPGIPRLGVPSLRESDASLGVAWIQGARKDGATGLPSGLALAATWNPDILYRGGAMIGAEAKAKGFNVLLAGGTNLMRDPRNGRTFEYLAEDPLLSGTLVGASIAGIQSNHIISTIKHFALNDQETGRNYVDVRISEPAARESDLLAFQIGIEKGRPGSAMCSYNKINGHHACDNDWLLNKVLKQDWRWPGFVMSDWGAVPGVSAAMNGLDQQSGAQLDKQIWFGKPLAEAAKADPRVAARLDEMNRRVLTAIYMNGLDVDPAKPGGTIDMAAHATVTEEAAKQAIVLLRNTRGALPLAASAQRIAIIGGFANRGVMSGGGSSQVQGEKGPAVNIPKGGSGGFGDFISEQYQASAPLKAIHAAAPKADIAYVNGDYVSEAVARAKQADVAIVFATQWATEGVDQPDLSLPRGQDALIEAVASANPNTIVVLENGNPVLMPWLDKTAAVLEAWYPGTRGGEAIASVLFGQTNPSGRLPVTFPASLEQLPRPKLDGLDDFTSPFDAPMGATGQLSTDYDIEGSDIGYRWNARKGQKALFPFGYGLSYTSFASSGLKMAGLKADFAVANTGKREGATVAQLYLVSRNGVAKQRLVAFQRVPLAAGESRRVSLAIDPRLLADWKDGGWEMPAGAYTFALGENAESLGPTVTVRFAARRWKD